MTGSIGKTIRRLRKERGFTQEELAEQLNVTSQAVSKWESESGMPDISQIVPLASVFGVTTDVLFGLDNTTETSEAWEIVQCAQAKEVYGQRETYLAAYDELAEGLKKYPANLILLNHCMNLGTSLSLPDNGWIYDPERGEQIARETVRVAELVVKYSQNTTEILTARQNLVFLYLAQGQFERAAAEARKLPARNGFTAYSFLADVHSTTGHHDNAITCLCSDLAVTLQVLEDDTARLGKAYSKTASTPRPSRSMRPSSPYSVPFSGTIARPPTTISIRGTCTFCWRQPIWKTVTEKRPWTVWRSPSITGSVFSKKAPRPRTKSHGNPSCAPPCWKTRQTSPSCGHPFFVKSCPTSSRPPSWPHCGIIPAIKSWWSWFRGSPCDPPCTMHDPLCAVTPTAHFFCPLVDNRP